MIDRETVIDKLNDMADYLLNKSYSDLLARDFYDTVGYAIALLKEQEAVVPTLDETSKRFYRRGVCGEYVGFIDSDLGDPDEKDNYCRNCGRSVKWDA